MRGYLNIANNYNLIKGASGSMGLFQWKRRMGIHLAFHRDPMNIFLHAVFPVFNALGILLICYPFFIEIPMLAEQPFSIALVVLAGSFLIYALVDVLAAALVSGPVLLLYPVCQWSFELLDASILYMFALGTGMFLFALWVQVGIGHKVCENGLGDEEENIAELFESKNPIPFVLLPVYTLLDLLFMLGYRKTQANIIWGIMNELRPKLEKELSDASIIKSH
jgi:uncharacterized membrane protein YGL010W